MSRPERASCLICAGLILAIASPGYSQGGDAALSAVRESDRADRAVAPRPRAEPRMSSLINRNVYVRGHRTSMRLEPEFWDVIEVASLRGP